METGRDLVIERQQDMEVLCACFIPSVPIKDRTIAGTSTEIKCMSLT